MPADRRRRRYRDLLRGAPLDVTDLVVVLLAAAVVAAVVGYSALMGARTAQDASAVTPLQTVTTPASTPTAARRLVDVIGSSDTAATSFAAGIASAASVPVKPFTGSGYIAAQQDYAALAARLDRDAGVVVLVPSDADAAVSPLEWKTMLARTVPKVAAAAPSARILIVGPVAADARSVALKPARDAILGYAQQTGAHYLDGVAHHWVGARVYQGLPTKDALLSAGKGIGAEVRTLVAD